MHQHRIEGSHAFRGTPAPAASPLLPVVRFSSEGLPPRDRFEAWRAAGNGLFETSPCPADEGGFLGEHTAWALGPMLVLWSRTSGVRFARDAARIRHDQCDHWAITAWRHGQTQSITAGQAFATRPGGLSFYGMHQTLDSTRAPSEGVKLFIPRDAMPEAAAALDACLGRPPETALARLLWTHVDSLASAIETMPAEAAPAVAEATLALVRAVVTGSVAATEAARVPLQAAQRARVMALIRRELASARLTPDRLARMAGLSRTQLYRVFEAQGGVARAVQRERLRAIARTLADPEERRPVAQVAEAFGMPDASAFSRVFRREYGVTPRAFREAALLGLGLPQGGSRAEGGFACLLRGLGC